MKCHPRLAQWLVLVGALPILSAPLSAEEPKPRVILQGHTEAVISLAFSPDGKTLASGGADEALRLWDVTTGKNITTLKDAGSYGWCSAAFSPDGKQLALAGGGNKIKLWNVVDGKSTVLFELKSEYARPTVVFSPDGKTLASGGMCIREMQLWDVTTGNNIATIQQGVYGIRAMAFTPDSKVLASIGRYEGTRRWDAVTGKEIPITLSADDKKRVEKLINQLGNEDFSEREKATKELEAIGPLAIELLKPATEKEDVEISSRAAVLVGLLKAKSWSRGAPSGAFSPDGKTLATALGNVTVNEGGQNVVKETGGIKLWAVATGKELATLTGHEGQVGPLVFSPDGKFLASGSEDRSIKLWDLATGKELAGFKGQAGEVRCLAFSPDGKMLASGSADKTIMLWDVAIRR
jgi:WD40 repeat protein